MGGRAGEQHVQLGEHVAVKVCSPLRSIFFSVWKGDMLDLLKWRTHPDKITGCLSKLKEIDGSEIVKVFAVALSLSQKFVG